MVFQFPTILRQIQKKPPRASKHHKTQNPILYPEILTSWPWIPTGTHSILRLHPTTSSTGIATCCFWRRCTISYRLITRTKRSTASLSPTLSSPVSISSELLIAYVKTPFFYNPLSFVCVSFRSKQTTGKKKKKKLFVWFLRKLMENTVCF